MTCTQAKTLLKEAMNYTDEELRCCDSCHEEAEEGYNVDVEMGSEPCCMIRLLIFNSGILEIHR